IVDDGPNYIGDSRLYLWGNNWLNANGSTDRADFQSQGGVPPGLDFCGEVPEPPVGLLLLLGLFGTGLLRRLRT
ncbi:MAG: PEP-CTERM sorting domain-containing protein, partial [Gammaproteobacteria bacterium]|nr:PEP-CTERM sorting domain-containing protein [Gammaproteobacteria bacterium]